MNDTPNELSPPVQPTETTMTTTTNENIMSALDALRSDINQRFAQLLSKEEIIALTRQIVQQEVASRPTMEQAQQLIATSQSAFQAQIQQQQEAAMLKVEALVNGVNSKMADVSLLLTRSQATNEQLDKTLTAMLTTTNDNTRRITEVEADTKRLHVKIETDEVNTRTITKDMQRHGEAIASMRDYFEKQKVWSDVKRELATAATNVVKSRAFLSMFGAVFGGGGLVMFVELLKVLGQ